MTRVVIGLQQLGIYERGFTFLGSDGDITEVEVRFDPSTVSTEAVTSLMRQAGATIVRAEGPS